MAKIVYVGLPLHGHTNPTLPIMRELVNRGHTVLYYNSESFRNKIEPTGVDFRSLPEPLPTEREISESFNTFMEAAQIFAGLSRHLARFLIPEFKREQPDLVLHDSAAMSGYIAARINRIPHICLITTFVLDGLHNTLNWQARLRFVWSMLSHTPKMMHWRHTMVQEFGKENIGNITEYTDVNIVFTSHEFHPKSRFIDERFHFVGPSLDTTQQSDTFPFEQLTAKTAIYISLGTVNHLNTAFYKTAFKAFGDYPAQFVMAVGKNTEIASLGQIPSNFIVQQYVPQLEVLQRVKAFITHGGMNSAHEGLYYGVPLLVNPAHAEQLLNGQRVADLGAGILLDNQRPVKATVLRDSLHRLLHEPAYREKAAQLGQTLHNAGGHLAAVRVIEERLNKP